MIRALRMFIWTLIVTGILYPLLITAIAQLTMKQKADGDLIEHRGHLVGARLIGQEFKSDQYFWGRPSAINYNPLPSGGSNLSPTNPELKKAVVARMKGDPHMPSELLYASGSGLDPDISVAAALYQIDRIAKARGIDKKSLETLIHKHTRRLLGPPCVNVLLLNVELDHG